MPGKMTVGDLIRRLKDFNPNMRVVVDGYEGGYQDIQHNNVAWIPIILNYNSKHDHDYCGPHEEAFTGDEVDEQVVIISRFVRERSS